MAKKTPWYLKVLQGPEAQVKKALTGRDWFAKKDDSADDYINFRLPLMDNYNGSKASFEKMMSQEADACAAYVKSKGVLVGGNNAREVCVAKIKAAYSPILLSFDEQAYFEEQSIKNEFASGDTTIYVIAAIAIIVVIYLYKN